MEAELYATTGPLRGRQGVTPLGARLWREVFHVRGSVAVRAALGLNHRAGLGKVRHIETSKLRIQDALDRRALELCRRWRAQSSRSFYKTGTAGHRAAASGVLKIPRRAFGRPPSLDSVRVCVCVDLRCTCTCP